jgi:hypothetical protein
MAFSAYSVAVRVSLVQDVTHGLARMSTALATTGRDVENLHGKLRAMGALTMGGAALLGGGMMGLHAMRAGLEEARKFQTEVANLRTLGIGEAATQDAVKFVKAMDVIGVSWTEKMRLFTEAQGVFRQSGVSGPGALAAAKLATPFLAQMRFANASLHPDEAGKMDASSMAMLRFVEMRGGLNSPQRFKEIATQGYKAIQGSKGNVSWELYRQFLATSGVAGQGMSDTAMFGQMEPVIGELKSRAGTAYMTSFNRLNGLVKLPNQVAHDLVNAGIWDGSKITWNSQGGIKAFAGNPLRDAQTFGTSQFDWYKANVLPWYQRAGFTPQQMDREDALIGGRTGGMMFSVFRRQQHVIEASVEAQRVAMTPEQAAAVGGRTLAGRRIQVSAQWANVKEAAGEALIPLAVAALGAFLPVLKAISDFSLKHPGMFKALILGFTGLSIMAVIGGYVLLLRAAFIGLGLVFSMLGGGGVIAGVVVGLGRLRAAMSILMIEGLLPWIGRLGLLFLRFMGPIGLVITAVALLITFWPQISAFFRKVKNGIADMLGIGAPGVVTTEQTNLLGGGERKRSPYVPSAAAMNRFASGGVVMMDGRKVGEIVSGHQAKATSQTRVGVVRHDPSATPAATAGGYHR